MRTTVSLALLGLVAVGLIATAVWKGEKLQGQKTFTCDSDAV